MYSISMVVLLKQLIHLNTLELFSMIMGLSQCTKKHIATQAQKAKFSVLKRLRELELPIDLQLELFDSLVLPILLYCCEI